MLPTLALLCCLSAPSTAEQDHGAAQIRIDAIEAEIRRKRETVLSAGSEYERLKAQRALDQSEEALRGAKRAMEEIKKTLQPGSKAWSDEVLIKNGREFRSIPGRDPNKAKEDEYKYGVSVPDVGPGAALDPLVHQHSWVGEPGSVPTGRPAPMRLPTVPEGNGPGASGGAPGEVVYGRPAGYRNSPLGPIRDPREGKSPEEKPAASLPNAPIPPSTATAEGSIEEREEGGPILDPNAYGDPGRGLPPLAPDGFTFDAPEGEMLKQFPELAVRPRDERERGLTLVRQAGRLLRAGDGVGALRIADRLIQIAGKDPGVHALRALILNRLGRFAEAEASARLSLSLDERGAASWRTLSWAQLKQGKAAAALRSAEKALALDAEDAAAMALRAYALERLGRRDQAVSSLRRAAAINPGAFSAAAARAAAGGPVAPSAEAPRPAAEAESNFPLWAGGVLAGGMLFGTAVFVFKWK